jgi:DNA-binding LacI/PurR family transcriptional regulator
MERRSIETIIGSLNQAGARYLIVGGLAVVAHGFVRFTADIDIVLDPDPAAMRRAIAALTSLGYRPRAPVPFEDFADAGKRQTWAREKSLTVFSVFSAQHPATEIDLFVESPFDFERAYADADRFEVASGVQATFVCRADLIAMKRKAGRPQDLKDVAELESTPGATGERDG